jgi:hypothetical protein
MPSVCQDNREAWSSLEVTFTFSALHAFPRIDGVAICVLSARITARLCYRFGELSIVPRQIKWRSITTF